ncbi:MarR family winged helix-turn-helix transcriptional regulator [Sphingomonas sp. Y38-1Y]|uniref:MarR family winged helix-turn-helix transcriptional regulator n=1 Tax=Sphingomonas sp. Y38-1Y TaxID=3078265 RepID=UPI0028F08501|nr:MarR family transcriptional regulator [Sphingomonas sp. Y38-1Y]
METSKGHSFANELSIMAVRLIRWLRAADTGSALSDPLTSAMAVIVHSGGIAPSALAELEQVRRPTITKVVDELVSRGLVRRERHATDGRATMVVATEEGLALWRAGQLRATAPLAERIEALDADELRRFEEALPLFARIMEPPAP